MSSNFQKALACPYCLTSLKIAATSSLCPNCQRTFEKKSGIWHLLKLPDGSTNSQIVYDTMHQQDFGGPSDGSYEILAALARGNKTVDIACGEGLIEKLAPETVAVEFSKNALIKAQKNGAKYLVLADAQALPFQNNSFDVAICAGSLEHFANPQKAILEMARVAKIQVMTVHRPLPIPFGRQVHDISSILLKIKHQPIEKPLYPEEVAKMCRKAKLHVVFKGVWTIPVNYGQVLPHFPVLQKIPACSFIISVKK